MENLHHASIDPKYSKKVAYFSMEFAIHQALKVYSGGLGFLAGSHMRSAHDLRQNVVGIGILWSFGYYDQTRNEDNSMNVIYRRKSYSFLEETGIIVKVKISGADVFVKAYLLREEIFGTVPVYLLTTDIPENDYLARTITHKLYEAQEETRIAQEIALGIGGAKVLEEANVTPEIYHMNEGHALPVAFHLYAKFNDIEEVKKRMVFTTHTPEAAGNEDHDCHLLHRMGFFNGVSMDEVKKITGHNGGRFSLTVGALKLSKIANAVSKLHGDVANKMWDSCEDRCPIIYITNAQNKKFWADKPLQNAYDEYDDYGLLARKKHLKRKLFDEVADQTGKMFDPEILTIVWSRRFAEYKRAGLIKRNWEKFYELVTRKDRPIQVIWAGKPHPADGSAIKLFNELVYTTDKLKRCAVLVRYEIGLSNMLKKGADIWLNTPRVTREASGTSGMSAAMNGAINFSINDGWHLEFQKHGENCYTIFQDGDKDIVSQDEEDAFNLMSILENEIIPTYYGEHDKWLTIVKNSMTDIAPVFDTGRMANEYYEKLYKYNC
ncbi:MAG TPA: alpha-glucan family phosphorylase [Campylobacterales bacterium]|nr:alpha-glucan family phosphorylase [Campylobacterales bacterium]